MMTDKDNNEIDFTKEIEELDSFLEEQEDIDFALDDDDSDFGTPIFTDGTSDIKEDKAKKKTRGLKVMGYFLLLCLLFGGAYAAYLFVPQYIAKPQLEKVSSFVSNEGGHVVGDLTKMFKSYIPTSGGNSDVEVVEHVPTEPQKTINSLPMPSDENLVAVDDVLSIADAMDFVQEAASEVSEPSVAGKQAEEIIQGLEDNIPNAPVIDLPELEVGAIEIANDVMDMPKGDLIDMVETVESATAPEVVEIAEEPVAEEQIPTAPRDDLIDTVEAVENVTAKEDIFEIVEEIQEEKQIPTAPKIEMPVVEIQTKKAVPVKVYTPKVVSQPKASKPVDARVVKAKSLLDKGDYNGALNLYRAILQSDPANTSALTGRQLAQAKLRMEEKPRRIVVPIEEKAPEVPLIEQKRVSAPIVQNQVPSAPVVTTRTTQPSGNVQSLLQQAQANPNNAVTAFNVGNAYKGSDNAKAMEWYRKALQIDVVNSSGIDRMAVYDAMADIQ